MREVRMETRPGHSIHLDALIRKLCDVYSFFVLFKGGGIYVVTASRMSNLGEFFTPKRRKEIEKGGAMITVVK